LEKDNEQLSTSSRDQNASYRSAEGCVGECLLEK